jgi:hypothetical protein
MAIDLSGVRAKIERAYELKNTLNTITSPVESEAPQIQISAEFDRHSRYYIFRVAAIPEDWRLRVGVLIGDTIHNARSALDYLIWQLAVQYISGPIPELRAKKIQFSVEDTSKEFTKRRKALQEIPSSYWTIFDAAQPYNGGNFLALLRDLSNDDKHRVLPPILVRPEVFEPIGEPFRWSQLVDFDNTHAEKHLKVGAEIVRMKLNPSPYPKADVEVAGYVTPHVLLQQGDRTVVNGLGGILTAAEDVVNDVTMHLKQLGFQV